MRSRDGSEGVPLVIAGSSARGSAYKWVTRTAADESVDQGLFAFKQVVFKEFLPVVAEKNKLVFEEVNVGALVAGQRQLLFGFRQYCAGLTHLRLPRKSRQSSFEISPGESVQGSKLFDSSS